MEHSHAADLLGIKPPFSQSEVKAAFKRLAGRTHPDKGGSSEAFQEARVAYDVCLSMLKNSGYTLIYSMLDVLFKARVAYKLPEGLACGYCAGDGFAEVPREFCEKCGGSGEVPDYLQDILGKSCACVTSVKCLKCSGTGVIPNGYSIPVDIKALHTNGYKQVFEALDNNHPFILHGKFEPQSLTGSRRLSVVEGRVRIDLYPGEERSGFKYKEKTDLGTVLDIELRNVQGVLTLHINGVLFKIDPVFPVD